MVPRPIIHAACLGRPCNSSDHRCCRSAPIAGQRHRLDGAISPRVRGTSSLCVFPRFGTLRALELPLTHKPDELRGCRWDAVSSRPLLLAHMRQPNKKERERERRRNVCMCFCRLPCLADRAHHSLFVEWPTDALHTRRTPSCLFLA